MFNRIVTSLLLIVSSQSLPAAGINHIDDQSSSENTFAYAVKSSSGATLEARDNGFSGSGEKAFNLVLVPEQGPLWDMGEITVLGLEFKNTGSTELVLDLNLCNKNATNWSNSSVGRTIVLPGESIPLGVGLPRKGDRTVTHPAYSRMSGQPNGTFRHWHTIDATRVVRLVIRGSAGGEYSFEMGSLFPMQSLKPELMGEFPFIDTFGQYIHKDWNGKVVSVKDIQDGVKVEKELVDELGQPPEWGQFGGWKAGPQFEGTGHFRTAQHNGRWWFIDPEGYLFWSFGVTCVGFEYSGQTSIERKAEVFQDLPSKDDPALGQFYTGIDVEDNFQLREDAPHFDFTRANLYRKYGEGWQEKAREQELERLHHTGLNTIGAWSDNDLTQLSDIPYTAIIHFVYASAATKLPDPFNPRTREGLRKSFEEYPVPFRNDPRCLGAFVNNELHWKNDSRTLVASILSFGKRPTAAKETFKNWLKEKYGSLEDFNAAWNLNFTEWNQLLHGMAEKDLKTADKGDCEALATLFADAYFSMVKEELNRFAPGVLYLGCRFNAAGNEVLESAGRYVDVISANIYQFTPFPMNYGGHGKPVLISEFHFGNLDGNNLGSGLRSAQDGVQQGRLLKAFLEEAIEEKDVIGAHWFQWRDQNVGGRYDGENYDIGFFDVADLPKKDLIRAAAEFAREMYDLTE